MNREEKITMQNEYIDVMIKNMPLLRAATNMTQAQLADKLGVSRQTIVAIETRKRPMPWSLYLAIVCIFQNNDDSKKMMESFNLFNKDLI